jgi:S-adenosylmethionine decarboxylase proenzyme
VRSLGSQLLVDMYGCDPVVLDDVERITAHMLEAAVAAGATVVHHRFHRFAPHGVSGMVILAESHLAIHTWPEHRFAAVDLFTCGATLSQDRCFAKLKERLQCERLLVVDMARGAHEKFLHLPESDAGPATPVPR